MGIIKKAELNTKYFEEIKDIKCICRSWPDFNKIYLYS